MKYMVVVEEDSTSWGAYVPDLPGCVAAGDSKEEALQLIEEAIKFHLVGSGREAAYGCSTEGDHSATLGSREAEIRKQEVVGIRPLQSGGCGVLQIHR